MCRLTKNIALKICKLKFLNRNKDLFKKNPLNFIQTYFMFGFALTFVNILTHIFSKIHYLFFIFWTGEKRYHFVFLRRIFWPPKKGSWPTWVRGNTLVAHRRRSQLFLVYPLAPAHCSADFSPLLSALLPWGKEAGRGTGTRTRTPAGKTRWEVLRSRSQSCLCSGQNQS